MHTHTFIAASLTALCTAIPTPAEAQSLFERTATIAELNRIFKEDGGDCTAKAEGLTLSRLRIACQSLQATQLSGAFINPQGCADFRELGFSEMVFVGFDGQQACKVTTTDCLCDAPPSGALARPMVTGLN